MKALIDTNVILDVLCSRKSFVKFSSIVWKYCEVSRIKGYISALSVPDIVYILRKELKIFGTWNSSYNDIENDWKESIKAMSEGKINVKPLITHKFPLSNVNEAFNLMKDRKEFYNKVILNMNEEEK